MRYLYLAVCLGVVVLVVAVARDEPEAKKRGEVVPVAPASPVDVPRVVLAAPTSPADAPRVVLESQKLGQSAPAAPAPSSDAPGVDLEAIKRGLAPVAAPASPADAPRVDLEELKRLGRGSVASGDSRNIEQETEHLSQLAVEAIPLKSGGSGPRILPFPDADGHPIPIGGSP